MRATLACLVAVLAAASLAACGKGGDDTRPPSSVGPAPTSTGAPIPRDAANTRRAPIVIGTMNFPEQVLLGRLYAGALGAAGYRVRVRSDLGSDEAGLKAVRSGSIDAFPAYLSSALARLRAGVVHRRAAAYARARAAFARRGLAVLPPTPFEDAPAFAVRRATAERLGGTRVSQLAATAGRLTLAGPPGCRRRADCAGGLRRVYGLRFRRVREVPLASRYAVLRDRRAHVSSVFTTDGALAGGDFVLLRDDRRLVPPYPVVVVVRRSVLGAAGQGLSDAVARLQLTLTTRAMQRLNARLAGGAPAPRVAAAHLRQAGLVR